MLEKAPCSESIRSAWKKIFHHNDPFRDPFQHSIDARLLMYPTYGYHLTEEQYSAFILTATNVARTTFYVSVVEYTGDFLARGEHWHCAMPEYEEYRSLPLVLENAIYAEDGTFGIVISHEDHALIAGTEEFVSKLKGNYSSWEEDQRNIKNEWTNEMLMPVLAALKRPTRFG